MSEKEIVRRTILFQNTAGRNLNLPDEYGTDIAWGDMCPSPDARPRNGRDEWGALWKNIKVSNLGEVKEFPLTDWADFKNLTIPDINHPSRGNSLQYDVYLAVD